MKVNRFNRISIILQRLQYLLLLIAVYTGLSAPAYSDTSLSSVVESNKLNVGIDIPYGFMEYLDESGKPAGVDVDIASAIGNVIKIPIEIKTMPFSELFNSLAENEIDLVISAVTITPERQKNMLFSVPYMDTSMYIAVRKDNSTIKSETDLRDRKIGVLKGTIGEDYAKDSNVLSDNLIIRFDNNNDRILALESGEIDAALVHFILDQEVNIRVVEPPLKQSFYGIVAKLGSNTLIEKINAILREMKRSGELEKIIQAHFP